MDEFDAADEDDADDFVDQELLTRFWKNERCAPTLLQFQDRLIEHTKELVERQEAFLTEKKDDPNAQADIPGIMLRAMSLDVDRVKFLQRSYHRARVHKIQKFHQAILKDDAEKNKLSNSELEFCQSFGQMMEEHFKECFLKHLPEELQDISASSMIPQPPIKSFIIVKSNEALGDVQFPDAEDTLDVVKDDILVIRYESIEGLVAEQNADLQQHCENWFRASVPRSAYGDINPNYIIRQCPQMSKLVSRFTDTNLKPTSPQLPLHSPSASTASKTRSAGQDSERPHRIPKAVMSL